MLPIMPPHFMNPSSRNGHLTKNKTTTTTTATITNSNDKDNFFKIENILNRTIDTTQTKKYLNNGNNKNNNNKKQQQLQNDKLNNNNNLNTINNGVYSIEKIPKDSITCSISSDELIKNCNNRKIKVKISNSDGYIRSISFKSDSSWIKNIQLAKDVHSNNVIIETTKLNNNQIRLRTIKDIDENEELIVWFSEEISIMMNIPFLTPINIRGNNCYTCHICKASFEYPNPLKIHLATSCTLESIDTLWKNLSYTMKKNCLVLHKHDDKQLIQATNIKSIQHQIPTRISSEELSSSVSPPLSLSLPTSTSLATHLLFSTHHNNFLMKSQQSSLYNSQYDRQSAFKPVTTPPPPPTPTTSSSLKQPQQLPQQLPPVTVVNHIPSHSFNLHRQNSICNFEQQEQQQHPILHKSSSMHYRPLFNSSLPTSSVSTTLFPSSSLFYSSASSLTTNALLATSLSSSSTSSLSPSIFSLSPHHHPHHHHHHQQITQQPITLSQTVSASQAAAAAAAALNAAAQIETIVSNMGASKQGHLCIYCGKLYSRKYGLKIHIRTHTGFKPLKCKYCFRPFGDPSNLNKHVRLHMQSGNLSFRCHLCNKTLARRRDLQRHIETKHCTGTMDNTMDIVVVDDDNNTSSPTSPFTVT